MPDGTSFMGDRDIITPVMQFGTSRFLQAHADLFFTEAEPPKTVTAVQSSGDAARAHRIAALAAPGGFPVHVRGIKDGRIVDEARQVTSIRRGLSTVSHWPQITAIFTGQISCVISNTGDVGFDPLPADAAPTPHQAMSYPAKLFHLLAARHRAGREPIAIFPLELVPGNGAVLMRRVMDVARLNRADDAMLTFLDACIWANSLVDRIVAQPIEPAGAIAEPYALWAIERQPALIAPCVHPAVRLVDDLDPVERLKLHILNLGHTVLVDLWRSADGAADLTVCQALEGPLGDDLNAVLQDEVLAGFGARGMRRQAEAYLQTTLERFANPFLDHRLSDIAVNHRSKIDRRLVAFVDWVRELEPEFAAPRLEAIARRAGLVTAGR